MKKRKKIIIMGAAGRDFHNFNVFFRKNHSYEVVAFTAEQIPGIAGRRYPPELSGKLYPNGIPIFRESQLPKLIKKYGVEEVVLAYSDLPHMHVMHKASIVNAAGADFKLMGIRDTMLKSKKPVIAITAVRTGCGKSPTTLQITRMLKRKRVRFVVVRHPMPYGDLSRQVVQRFERFEDLDKYNCTIEEREEYGPHLENLNTIYAGVDYQKILRRAEREADVIVWDGGNNDFPFFKPDLWVTLTDALRPGHEVSYYPGELNLRMADVVIINKEDAAPKKNCEVIKQNIQKLNPRATVIDANSQIIVEKGYRIRKKKVVVIEDGPTLTHGNLSVGAGYIAARRFQANIIDPRKYAVGSIKETFKKYGNLKRIIPAMGYSKKQVSELKETINKAKADAVVIGTPIDLRKLINMNKPAVRIRYKISERGKPKLEGIINKFIKKHKLSRWKWKGRKR